MTYETLLIDSIGWLATAVVVASFFFDNPLTLRTVQIFGAVLWLLYGTVIESSPVIVANALVFGAATWSVARSRRVWKSPERCALEPWSPHAE